MYYVNKTKTTSKKVYQYVMTTTTTMEMATTTNALFFTISLSLYRFSLFCFHSVKNGVKKDGELPTHNENVENSIIFPTQLVTRQESLNPIPDVSLPDAISDTSGISKLFPTLLTPRQRKA